MEVNAQKLKRALNSQEEGLDYVGALEMHSYDATPEDGT